MIGCSGAFTRHNRAPITISHNRTCNNVQAGVGDAQIESRDVTSINPSLYWTVPARESNVHG